MNFQGSIEREAHDKLLESLLKKIESEQVRTLLEGMLRYDYKERFNLVDALEYFYNI